MADHFNNPDNEWYKLRLLVAMVIVIVMFCILGVRLLYLQVVHGHEYKRLSENNCIRLQDISPQRGQIYDRNGVLLVDNRPSFDLTVVPKDAQPLKDTLIKLASCSGESFTELYDIFQASKKKAYYNPVVLIRDIPRDILARVEVNKFDLPGIHIAVNAKRHYIYGNSLAHVLGYLGEISLDELKNKIYPDARSGDMVGKYGIEKAAQTYLQGRLGKRLVEVDARGRVIRILKTQFAHPGNNVYLTIDHELQQFTESLMKDKTGAVVAVEPETGNILAMVSSPSFDPNAFIGGISSEQWRQLTTDPGKPLTNKAIRGVYPPASTYKIVTAIAGLEENVINLNTRVYCPGHYEFGDRTFRCWKRSGHGSVDVVQALAQSCDVFFYQVGQKLGVDRLAKYAFACGLGKPTGIALSPESKGLIPTSQWKRRTKGVAWQKGETLSVAIGQGYNLTTPLQLAMLTVSVANGGKILRPHIIKEIRDPFGKVVDRNGPEVIGRLPVSDANLHIIRQGLWHVVNGPTGTARIARIDGIDVCGKTGTAQVVSRKKNTTTSSKNKPKHHRPHAWFVAYAPSENPKIAVAVFVEHGEKGSGTAAPIARDVIKLFLGYHDSASITAADDHFSRPLDKSLQIDGNRGRDV